MIKELIHDPEFLAVKSTDAGIDDISVARDLLDTITAHKDDCVGMAANMIGVNKNIIIFDDGKDFQIMFNPVITLKKTPYQTKEGCLSLLGLPRPCTRYKYIKVDYYELSYKSGNPVLVHKIGTFKDFTAQIIQHEIDHCNGILI